jgi:hypothetical protein
VDKTREELACAKDHHLVIQITVDHHQATQTTVDHHQVICHQATEDLLQAILKIEVQVANQANLAHNVREVLLKELQALATYSVINEAKIVESV